MSSQEAICHQPPASINTCTSANTWTLCTYTRTPMYIHLYIWTPMNAYLDTHVCTPGHPCMYIWTPMYATPEHPHMHTWTPTYAHFDTHVCTHRRKRFQFSYFSHKSNPIFLSLNAGSHCVALAGVNLLCGPSCLNLLTAAHFLVSLESSVMLERVSRNLTKKFIMEIKE